GINPANLSVSTHALEALYRSRMLEDKSRFAALAFVKQCQNWPLALDQNGGFHFTPDPLSALNKAGTYSSSDGRMTTRSYYSATCDGVAALWYCGVPPDHARFSAALDALNRMPAPRLEDSRTDIPGETVNHPGLFFYAAASLARVWQLTHDVRLTDQRVCIQRTLVETQRPDGSWKNLDATMREDDPLIATSLALTALLRLTAPH
ncbi:MAG: hypothetical protein KF861_14015, partial [Planctomycetaceae bacterium]|nr:hypothetical protein [Planctomycetaceae bacterium]